MLENTCGHYRCQHYFQWYKKNPIFSKKDDVILVQCLFKLVDAPTLINTTEGTVLAGFRNSR